MADFNSSDTIAAVATAHGRGGIAVVRVAGPEAFAIAGRLWRGKSLAVCLSHTAHLGNIVDPVTGDVLDQAVATVFRAPGSYTGDDTVEFSVHGSPYVQSQLIRLLIEAGCRLAEPGEYTRRAFVAGHLDLAEAEAVADLIAADSRNSHRIALNQMRGKLSETLGNLRERLLRLASLIELELDFSEEDVAFASRAELSAITAEIITILKRLTDSFASAKAIREGVPMAIAGSPNVGKSTLLNTLADDDRAIVSPIPGTTRDTIEDTVDINGTVFRIIDTAGLRSDPSDTIEAIGIERSRSAITKASIVIWVVDPTACDDISSVAHAVLQSLKPDSELIVAINKSDIAPGPHLELADSLKELLAHREYRPINITANSHEGIEPLLEILGGYVDSGLLDSPLLTNARHYQAAAAALEAMNEVAVALSDDNGSISLDIVALDLRAALHHLGEITGTITTPDILATIFSTFCIGK